MAEVKHKLKLKHEKSRQIMYQARIQRRQRLEGHRERHSYLCIVLELQRCTLGILGWRCQTPHAGQNFTSLSVV